MPDLEEIKNYDTEGMLELILDFPEQLCRAVEGARETKLSVNADHIQNVCVSGMGGSAIAGDVIEACVGSELEVPYTVNRNYTQPGFVNEKTLAIFCSYSGNTEETLAAYDEACRRRAQVVCITSGGKLAELAEINRQIVFRIPDGQPPRSALGYLAVPLAFTLWRANLIASPVKQLEETISILRSVKAASQRAENQAKEIAAKLMGRIPLIYSAAGSFAPVGRRWRGQICENSKMLAFSNVFPELNHNEIVGWGPVTSINQNFQVVYLRDRETHPRVQRRMQLTREIIEKHTTPVIQVESQGVGLFARVFSLIYLGDFVSFFLAIRNKLNPTAIQNIDFIKMGMQNS